MYYYSERHTDLKSISINNKLKREYDETVPQNSLMSIAFNELHNLDLERLMRYYTEYRRYSLKIYYSIIKYGLHFTIL